MLHKDEIKEMKERAEKVMTWESDAETIVAISEASDVLALINTLAEARAIHTEEQRQAADRLRACRDDRRALQTILDALHEAAPTIPLET